MVGIRFDFDKKDIAIGNEGLIYANIDVQNVALIAISQVCMLTKPEVGAQIGARLPNIKRNRASIVLADAKRQAEQDGAKNVSIELTENNKIIFKGQYED